MELRKVGVVGAGTMGAGIATLFALKKFSVLLTDKSEAHIQKGLERATEKLKKEQKEVVREYSKTSADLSDLKNSDLVIEAVFEDQKTKKAVLSSISETCSPEAVIASNTSSISISELSETVETPSRFIGMHFMNPPVLMKLIEIVRGEKTSSETVRKVLEITEALGKTHAVVNDSPGFVSNRLLFVLINESVKLLETGIAEKTEIDKVMKYGMNHPMGPLELADFIGLDVCLEILDYLFETLGDEKFKPFPVLKSLVSAGKLGKKTGEGFYVYTP
ncbi:MAG: 3-hydroxyacyl-CoA dehydrogenase family protein [Nitrospinota bacterium]